MECFDLSPSGGTLQEPQQKRAQRAAEDQHAAEAELETVRPAGSVGRKKLLRVSSSNSSQKSPTDAKTNNTGPTCQE